MVTRALLTALALAALVCGGCALVLGFEDHEPFPASEGGGGAGASGGTGGRGGEPQGGGGAAGGQGGEGATMVPALLIPDRLEGSVGIYSATDGTYLRDFVPPPTGAEPFIFSAANNAVQGPDGRIYVSDQLEDHVVCFEVDGSFRSIFVDQSDGLDNLRGIDFRGGDLFLSVSPAGAPFVARFDASGSRLADFVDDGSDPFDILFLPSGTMLMADISEPDNLRLYDVDASSFVELTAIDFPQQIKLLDNGNFVVAGWSEVIEIEPDGDVVRSLVIDIGRGVHPLANGNWLISSEAGVIAVNPFSQQLVQTARVGTGFSKIERVMLPPAVVQGGGT